jgi:hypothetical protein
MRQDIVTQKLSHAKVAPSLERGRPRPPNGKVLKPLFVAPVGHQKRALTAKPFFAILHSVIF